MENSEGSINVFVSGVLPKEKYSDVNELARDIASVLRIDQDRIVVDLVPLEDLKGEQGEEGPRGLQGEKGPKGDKGDAGPSASEVVTTYQVIAPDALVFTWTLLPSFTYQKGTLLLTGVNSLVIVGATNGMIGTLLVHQAVTGAACTLSFPANSKFPGGTHPVITATNDALDMLTWRFNGIDFYWTFEQDFKP